MRVFFIAFFLIVYNLPILAQPDLVPYRQRDKWGFADHSGKLVISPQYQETKPFVVGVAMVNKDAKWGLVNKEGKELVAPKYDKIYDWSDGIAKVKLNNKFGYINNQGQEICEIKYNTAEDFHEGLAFVRLLEWGAIDSTGKTKIKHKFTASYHTVNGKRDFGYARYKFMDGVAKIRNEKGYGYINKKGKKACKYKFSHASSFRNGVAVVEIDKKWGLINRKFKQIVPCEYGKFGLLSGGLIAARKNGRWGYIDTQGNVKIDFQYNEAYDFEHGLARVKSEDGYGFIDTSNKVIVPLKYNFIGPFKEGLAATEWYERWGFTDTTGKRAIQCINGHAAPFFEGLASVKDRKSHLNGYMNHTGDWVIQPKYDKAYFFKNGLAKVMYEDRWGYIDKEGKEYFGPGPHDTVTVSTAEELISSLFSNRTIMLQPGKYELYDLKNLQPVWEKEEVHDFEVAPKVTYSSGPGITFRKFSNLNIIGLGNKPSDTRILMKNTSDFVLTFAGCSKLLLQNIEIGHTEGAGGVCDGGVLLLAGCDSVYIDKTILFGSGTVGIAGHVEHLRCTDMTIKECSEGIISFEQGGNHFTFKRCLFINNKNEYGPFFNLNNCEKINFANCIIKDNKARYPDKKENYLFDINNGKNVVLSGCRIENNKAAGLWKHGQDIYQVNTKASGNSFQDEKGNVKTVIKKGKKSKKGKGKPASKGK